MSANPKQYDHVWANWQKWFGTAANTVHGMFLDRQLFDELRNAILEQAPDQPAPWLAHYARCYLAKQGMAARRIMDKTDDAESLWWVLHGLETSPRVLDRQRFIDAAPNQQDWAIAERHAEFDRLRAPDGDWINPEIITWFRLILEADADRVVDYATKAIAHTDRRGAPPLTWLELTDTINDIGARFQEFGVVLHATHYELLPYVEGDWQAPFRQPLFEPWTVDDFGIVPGG